MSVTESKAKAPVKTSKKSVNPAESAALKAALEAAQVEMVPLSALVKSPLNVRTIPYLGLLSKAQIVAALKEAGLTGAASDAEKMKKGDAASHAEQWLSGSRWVPGWMQSPDAAKPDDAHAAPDTDEPTSHAA